MKTSHIFILSILIGACSPQLSTDWTKEGYSGHSFKKIAVVGISDNLRARMSFEDTAIEIFKKKGVNAVQGINIFPPNMSKEDQAPENLIKIIKRHQLDGVITMSLIDSDESKRYQQGESHTYPTGYYRFGRYYYRTFHTVRTPGYYVSTKSYLIESVLYDLSGELSDKKEKMVWKGQSALVDPSSIESAAKSYAKKLVNHTLENNIVRVN
ncbi:MAG: hypothetical protein ACFB2Y_11020 [Fulvivirga sp.]